MTLLEGLVSLLLLAVTLVVLARNRHDLGRHWALGLSLGFLVLALAVPEQVARALFLDPDALLQSAGFGGGLPRSSADLAVWLGLGVRLAFRALQAAWVALLACAAAAEWARVAPGRSLLGGAPEHRRTRWLAALVLGIGIGVLSAVAFHALGVGGGPDLDALSRDYPGLAAQSPAVQTLVSLPTGCSAAFSEEVTFRGMLLGFLLAVGGRGRLGPIAAVVLTTLVWALLHLSMTDAPMIKLGQIAFVGLLLAALARRGGLGEAILAHLGLNVAGAATALAFAPLSAP